MRTIAPSIAATLFRTPSKDRIAYARSSGCMSEVIQSQLHRCTKFVSGLALGLFATHASAQVSWLDPLQYQKPAYVPVAMPNEATVPYKYYVDFQNGSGTSCTQSSPCRSLDNVIGKPGTAGGPAYIYLRGTGNINLYLTKSLYGSAGNEIVVKPWDSSLVVLNGENIFHPNNSNRLQYIIVDGGPNLGIHWKAPNSEFVPALSFNSDSDGDRMANITIARTRFSTGTSAGNLLAIQGVTRDITIVNNEFFDSNPNDGRQHQIYPSAYNPSLGSGPGTMLRLKFLNNVIRDIGGDGIEFNLRTSNMAYQMDDVLVQGNAFHNIGKMTCSASWGCRPAITLACNNTPCNIRGVVFQNNLIWDTGEGAVRAWLGSPLIANNTIYDWGKGNTSYSWAFYGYRNDGRATISNNIIYSPSGKNPFDGSSFAASNNLCAPGKSCGSSSRVWSSGTVVSVDPNSTNFVQLGGTSEARDSALPIASLTVDYAGKPRPPYDIGALTYGAPNPASLPSPTNLRVQ